MDMMATAVATEHAEEPLFAAWAEAPAREEMKTGRPLTPQGASGKIWNRLLWRVGVRRRYVTIGNVCDTKLPNNNTEYLWKVTQAGRFKAHEQWDDMAARFRQRVLEEPTDLHFLLGETPVVAFFGPDYAKRFEQIRGHPFFSGRKVIIPINHPASALPGRTPSNFWLIWYDLMKGMRLQQEGRDVKPFKIWIPGRNQVEHRL